MGDVRPPVEDSSPDAAHRGDAAGAGAPEEDEAGEREGPEPLPKLGSMQHERAALWVLVRYMPVLVGLVLALSFGSSVLYDNEDLAHCSWSTGGELLGAFGDFARLLLVPLFLASAILKRGARCLVRLVETAPHKVVLMDEAGKLHEIPKEAVRSVFTYPTGDGSQSIVIELSRGLFAFGMQGDRLTLSLEPEDAKRVTAVLGTEDVDVALATRSPRHGGVLLAVSLVLGTALGVGIFRALWTFVEHMPRASHYLPVVPDADRGWLSGLAITSMGVVHALLAWLSSPSDVTLGRDALRLKGAFGAREIPYASIESVTTGWHSFVIELENEERIERTWLSMDRQRLVGFVDALRGRVAEARDEVPVPSGLTRGSAPVTAWRESLRRRAATGAYRVGALDPDALVACVTGTAVPREVRIGAAIALSSGKSERDRERLRDAAAEVAHPRLRALYEQLAEGEAEDEEIEALLGSKR
jgi:hypothetical protein